MERQRRELETKQALFLTRPARAVLDAQDLSMGWSHVAASLADLSGRPFIAVDEVVAASTVVTGYRDLLAAWCRMSPDRVERLWAMCGEHATARVAEGSLEALWAIDPGGVSREAVLLSVIAANPALRGVQAATGAGVWRENSALVALAESLEREDARLVVPQEMPAGMMEMLLAPALARPTSLREQIQWMAQAWGPWLSSGFSAGSVLSQDMAAEAQTFRPGGPGPARPPGLDTDQGANEGPGSVLPSTGPDDNRARFSDDTDWMPGMVMVAKQTFVWLDQLSRTYGREITRLDEIPDEALSQLASWGFRGLWLIGLWERSPASQRIKVHRGDAEASASAYSLSDYTVAERLGGQAALLDLKHRAEQQGIRLAADMVPNHTGMDSRWMIEHPDWFVQLPQPPYAGYSFTGPNVSGDERIEVYLEDGYWSERDAAVVFKAVNRACGRVRYVYHGNDGTQMPWNDTAQLDYLKPEVREAVIETILEVARQFPIIRFDAAMTLARQHIARLWYPAPGAGGAIPSRAEHSVPPEVFDRLLPREFWREVVERVQAEVPDTLLLAEAFWMMEGFFVRQLGMHRVYNSAFMHMLRDEDNAGYRSAIKQVLAYSPAILERYVNFMNNPDEESAADQFGRGDKYFCIATLMATLPGLPMFGHGQLEGFAEKYGMEFTRARRHEDVDVGLLEHHERVICPLLHGRHLFCGVQHFALIDFEVEGGVDENVFVFVNRSTETGEASLVLANNHHRPTSGWARMSCPVNVGEPDDPQRVRSTLGEALGLENDPHVHYSFVEQKRQTRVTRTGAEVHRDGLFVELSGYDTMVFMDIRKTDAVRPMVEADGEDRPSQDSNQSDEEASA